MSFSIEREEPNLLSDTKYPDVTVTLTGIDGNALTIIHAVSLALRHNGAPPSDIGAFVTDATSGDYDHVLQTAMRWVVVV